MSQRSILSQLSIVVVVLSTQQAFCAANFNLASVGTNPTTIIPGQTVTAHFTLTNMTNTQRSGYMLTGLPSTVTQNTTPGHCTNPINLSAHASCDLEVEVTGAVSLPLGICKGNNCTNFATSLNVGLQHVAYIVNSRGFSLNSTLVRCNVNASDGSLSDCDAGVDTQGINSGGIAINQAYTYAYVSNHGATSQGTTIARCPMADDGTIVLCEQPTQNLNIYGPQGMSLSRDQTQLYVANQSYNTSANSISICYLSNDTINHCDFMSYPTDPVIDTPPYVQLNSADNGLYVSNLRGSQDGNGNLLLCSIDSPLVCEIANPNVTINRPVGFTYNANQTYAYISTVNDSGVGVNDVLICPMNQRGLIEPPCTSFGYLFSPALTNVQQVTLNDTGTVLYAADSDNGVVYNCQVNQSGNALTSCHANTGNGSFLYPEVLAYR